MEVSIFLLLFSCSRAAKYSSFVRIMFDAMTTDRPYRSGLPLDYALEELRKGAGEQFDPSLTAVFIRLIRSRSIPLSPQAASRAN